MAEVFNTILSQSNASAGPGNLPQVGAAPIQTNIAVEQGFKAAANLLGMAAAVASDHIGQTTQKNVDAAIEGAFTRSFDIIPGGDIDKSLGRLSALKTATEQGRDVSDRFQLELMKEVKRLKTESPHMIQKIDAALRERGLVDPRVQLMVDQKERDKRAELTEFTRQELALQELGKRGGLIYTVAGDPTSPIDRPASLKKMNDILKANFQEKEALRFLGMNITAEGNTKWEMRAEYAKRTPELRGAIWHDLNVGTRQAVNRVQTMIRSNASINDVHGALADIVQQANNYRSMKLNEVMASLNPAELEDYQKFLDSTIQTVITPVMEMKDMKDLNQIKAAASAIDIFNKKFDIANIQHAPDIVRISRLGEGFSKEAASIAMATDMGGIRTELTKTFTEQLRAIAGLAPSGRNPKSSDLKTSPDPKLSSVEKDKEASVAGKFIVNTSKSNTIISSPEDSSMFVSSLYPLAHAYGDNRLSPRDKEVLADTFSSGAFRSNATKAFQDFPEHKEKAGAFAFDVIHESMIKNVRELLGETVKYQDLSIEWNDYNKKFEVSGKEFTVETTPLTLVDRTFSDPDFFNRNVAARKRLDTINDRFNAMLETRQFKEKYKGISNDEFIANTERFLNNILTPNKAESIPISQSGAPSDMTNEVLKQEKKEFDFFQELEKMPKIPPSGIKMEALPDVEKGASMTKEEVKFNDAKMLSELWGKGYHGMNDPVKKAAFIKKIYEFDGKTNEKAVALVNSTVDRAFAGDGGSDPELLKKAVYNIGVVESNNFTTTTQYGGGPARGWWQVEPATAKDMISRRSGYLGVEAVGLLKEHGLDVKKKLTDKQLATALKKPEINVVFAVAKFLEGIDQAKMMKFLKKQEE